VTDVPEGCAVEDVKPAEPAEPDEPAVSAAWDVIIIGDGLAGLALAIELRKRDLAVAVIGDPAAARPTLGETLEFTGPTLLRRLGCDPLELLAAGIAAPKHNVTVMPTGAASFEIWPPGWFRRAPFFCSNYALHIDRGALDDELRRRALEAGAVLVADRVTSVSHHGPAGVITAVRTRAGSRLQARWYVDASGHRARIIGRALNIERQRQGPERVAFYTRVEPVAQDNLTRLHFGPNGAAPLTWTWYIPIGADRVSIGTSFPAAAVRAALGSGQRGAALFQDHLASAPEPFSLGASPSPATGPEVTSVAYTPFTHVRTSGPNWLLVGDAAALVDPLTSSGVAAAVRGAVTGAELIEASLRRGGRQLLARRAHHHSTSTVVRTVNALIGNLFHGPGLRRHIGVRLAAFVYATATLICHSWYMRLNPTATARAAPARLVCHGALLALARGLARVGAWLEAQQPAPPTVAPAELLTEPATVGATAGPATAASVAAVGRPSQSSQR